MKRLALLTFLLASTAVYAQQSDPIHQSGRVTPGHPWMVITNNAAGDGGTAAQGLLTGIGVTASGPGICQNSGPVTAGFNQICLGVTPSGGTLSVQNYNGASGPLNLAGNVALPALAGQVQCLQVNAVGVITGTGQSCGSGGAGGAIGGLAGQLQFNNNGVLGGVSTATTNGSTIFFSSGAVAMNGASSGFALLIAQTVASGTLSLPNGTDTLAGVNLTQTLTNKTLSAPILSGTWTGTATLNGTLTFNGSNNFSSSSFLWNGVAQTFPTSGQLVGVADTQVLQNKSINTSEINSGIMDIARLPVATAALPGIVQGDGSTLSLAGAVISCTTATTTQIGCGQPDGTTITVTNGIWTSIAPAAASITVGTTNTTNATNGYILNNNAGVLGQIPPTGTGNVVLSNSPTLSGSITGNLTFVNNLTFSGVLASGAIASSLCLSATGQVISQANQSCFGVGVLALNTLQGNVAINGGVGMNVITSAPSTIVLSPNLRNYIGGCTLANDNAAPNTVLDTAACMATNSTNVTLISISTLFTKSVAGAWAAGSGANGMGNGLTIAPSTWYHVCFANNNGTPDEWFDTSVTCANKPSGISDTKFRRLGSFKTNASSNIIAFTQRGDQFTWTTRTTDQSIGSCCGAATVTVSVPTGLVLTPILGVFAVPTANLSGWGGSLILQTTNLTQTLLLGDWALAPSGIQVQVSAGFLGPQTNTSAQISATTTTGSGGLSAYSQQIYTQGWIDTRGQ